MRGLLFLISFFQKLFVPCGNVCSIVPWGNGCLFFVFGGLSHGGSPFGR
jgi:hypothetical protein